MKYEILDTVWFTPPRLPGIHATGIIGIVAIASGPNDEWKCYIGYGRGNDEDSDAQLIAAYGAPIGSKEAACGFFPLPPADFRY